ncbi:MAG: catalase-related domain-containing protein, partial [Bauldia litoralis]
GGPREAPDKGFVSVPVEEAGAKERVRSETFADHYSQARQFYLSQTEVEQAHMKDALVFELSKVDTPAIRERIVSHLLNIDTDLAKGVADGLRLDKMPKAADAAMPPRTDLDESPALSIIANGPDSFAGRTVGALVTDGVDAGIVKALRSALKAEGAALKFVAPHIGGMKASDGSWIEADEKVDGGPSVLFDAVAVLPSEDGVGTLLDMPPARDFVADAFAHGKFIAHVEAAAPLFEKAGVEAGSDDGFVALGKAADAKAFVAACRKLRCWEREAG